MRIDMLHGIESVEELRKMSYPQYLHSVWWGHYKRLNKKAKCEKCGFKHELDIHHLNYDNLGDEAPADIITLCRRCHRDLHYYQRRKEANETMIRQQYVITESDYQKQQEFLKVADRRNFSKAERR